LCAERRARARPPAFFFYTLGRIITRASFEIIQLRAQTPDPAAAILQQQQKRHPAKTLGSGQIARKLRHVDTQPVKTAFTLEGLKTPHAVVSGKLKADTQCESKSGVAILCLKHFGRDG
jgi:hypothetical protein